MSQTTHVAAQYGQTAFLYHIISKWNADPDVPDNDGRSPLHWSVLSPFFLHVCPSKYALKHDYMVALLTCQCS